MARDVLSLTGVVKDYRGLRPLRIDRFELPSDAQVAILGMDEASAEAFVHLVTAAALPDRGEVHVFGQPTDTVPDAAAWLSLVDRFGIVTPRAVFLEALSVVQNLAVPLSLEIEPPPAELRERAVAVAEEVGLDAADFDRPLFEAGPASRLRVALGRALALDPTVVLLEHPSSSVPRDEAARLGADIRRILERRGVAALTLTADEVFAHAVARRVMQFDPASGRLRERSRRWLPRW